MEVKALAELLEPDQRSLMWSVWTEDPARATELARSPGGKPVTARRALYSTRTGTAEPQRHQHLHLEARLEGSEGAAHAGERLPRAAAPLRQRRLRTTGWTSGHSATLPRAPRSPAQSDAAYLHPI